MNRRSRFVERVRNVALCHSLRRSGSSIARTVLLLCLVLLIVALGACGQRIEEALRVGRMQLLLLARVARANEQAKAALDARR